MSNYSDEILARKTAKDQNAFNPLVEKYAEKIRRYIARIIGNWDEAEDLTQDVFLKAYKNINSFNPKLKFSSWLYRIAHNESVNFIKKHYRFKRVEFKDEIKNKLLEEKNALSKILEKENIKLARNGLLKLKTSDREILELFYFENKSYSEVSDILQMPINSVGPKVKRAKDKLKKMIKDKNEQIK